MKYDESRVGSCGLGSPPSRGAWIEIRTLPTTSRTGPSPPSRGAWIEIMKCLLIEVLYAVAPLAGGVK